VAGEAAGKTGDGRNRDEVPGLLSDVARALAINLSIEARGDEEIRGEGGRRHRRNLVGFSLPV